MIRFLAKRLAMLLGILLTISVLVYAALDLALDPLDELRTSTAPNAPMMIEQRRQMLRLDDPWWERYLSWLYKLVVHQDLGVAWKTNETVVSKLGPAMLTSLQLVFASTLLAIVLGVTVGLISALRQYSGFDYFITVLSFMLYALPVFWVAVLLKQYWAIGMNDYLRNPVPNWMAIALVGLAGGLFWSAALGGRLKRRLTVFAIAFAVTFGIVAYVLGSGWLEAPSIGVIGVAVIGLICAVTFTAGFAGLRNRRALYSALTTAVVGVIMYFAMQWVFYGVEGSDALTLGLLLVTLAVCALIGYLWGGPDRGVSMRVSMGVGFVMALCIFCDRVMQEWGTYISDPNVNGRPIATMGSITPGLSGNYWTMNLDKFTHLILPTVSLILISFATYTRYQRGSMLEVMNQDYIRTARAKGLSERVVIVRHALRNALLPLASMIPVDLLVMVGGAILTESIFGWSGMGKFFRDSLANNEVDPTMAYVVIIGGLAMIANLVADFCYAILDPRIRVNA